MKKTKTSIRKDVISILENIKFSYSNNSNSTLKKGLKELNQFVDDHPDLLITRADKSSTTVILNFKDYNEKIYEIESDNNIYKMTIIFIKKDPTSKLRMKTRILLTRWRTKDYIDQSTYKKIVYIGRRFIKVLWVP